MRRVIIYFVVHEVNSSVKILFLRPSSNYSVRFWDLSTLIYQRLAVCLSAVYGSTGTLLLRDHWFLACARALGSIKLLLYYCYEFTVFTLCVQGIASVSYTHLDVYKRQPTRARTYLLL